MDLSKLSNEDLVALKAGDLSKVSDAGLQALRSQTAQDRLRESNPAEYDPQSKEFQAKYGPAGDGGTLQIGPLDTGINIPAGAQNFMAGAGKSMYDYGRGAGQWFGLVSRDDVKKSREMDAPLMQTGAGKVGAFTGAVAPALATALIPGANTMVGAAAIGGGLGALAPSASTGETAANIGLGGALGPTGLLLGRGAAALYRGGKALLEPFTEAGQQRIAGRTLEAFAGGREAAQKAAQNIEAGGQGVLAGVKPTSAELANNAGIAQLERTIANNPEYTHRLADHLQGNRNALLGALDSVAGDETSLNAATAARETTAEQMYGAARKQGADAASVARANQATQRQLAEALRAQGVQTADEIASAQAAAQQRALAEHAAARERAMLTPGAQIPAKPAPVTVDTSGAQASVKTLNNAASEIDELSGVIDGKGHIGTVDVRDLLARPAIRSAIASAKTTAENFGESIQNANPVQVLHWAKKALDGKISEAVRAGNNTQAASLKSAQSALLKRIEDISPGYKEAAAKYAEMSVPINQMEVGQAVRNKLVPAIADFGAQTRLRPEAFAQALRAGDATAQSATGFSGAKIADVMTPEQMTTLKKIGEQLARRVNADELGRAKGSPTGQNIVSQNVLKQFMGPFGLPESMMQRAAESSLYQSLMRPAQWAGKIGEERAMDVLAQAALDPKLAAKLLKEGVPPEAIGMLRHQGYIAPTVASGTNAARQ